MRDAFQFSLKNVAQIILPLFYAATVPLDDCVSPAITVKMVYHCSVRKGMDRRPKPDLLIKVLHTWLAFVSLVLDIIDPKVSSELTLISRRPRLRCLMVNAYLRTNSATLVT